MNLNDLKCSNCGGVLLKNNSIYICNSCGSTFEQKQMDSKIFVGLAQAENERNSAEFLKAKEILNRIVELFPDDDLTEVYWNLLLCNQNVIFEKDGKNEMFPSFYRISNNTVFESQEYLKTIEYCQKYNNNDKEIIYKSLAEKIENARKMYLDIEKNTKPYDVFICFKKSDELGNVTKDTQLALDIYNELSSSYKIFFSEKSLSNIKSIYRNYEPNIYYGLYTAKVLLLICSKKEYIESTWLKNEWKRFDKINTKNTNRKCIIPIFMDGFNPNDLPNELWHNQGIFDDRKLISNLKEQLSSIINPVDELEILKKQQEELKKSILAQNTNIQQTNNITALLKRAYIFLEDREFENANNYAERILDINPECYEAYIIKLLCELNYESFENLKNGTRSIHNSSNYQKALKFANTQTKSNLLMIANNLEEKEKSEAIYLDGLNFINSNRGYQDNILAIESFSKIQNYKDSNQKLLIAKQKLYNTADNYLKLQKYQLAQKCLLTILDFKDSQQKYENIKEMMYINAVFLLDNKNYLQAIDLFNSIKDYKDSNEKINLATEFFNQSLLEEKYKLAISQIKHGHLTKQDITSALKIFEGIKDYKDSKKQIEKLNKKLALLKYKIVIRLGIVVLLMFGFGIFIENFGACGNAESEPQKNIGVQYFNDGTYDLALTEFQNNNEVSFIEMVNITKRLSEIEKTDLIGHYLDGQYYGENKNSIILNHLSNIMNLSFNLEIKYNDYDCGEYGYPLLKNEYFNQNSIITSLYEDIDYKKLVGWYFADAKLEEISNTYIITLNPYFIDKEDTVYIVKTYLENIDNEEYSYYETFTCYGEVGNSYNAYIKDYEGFYEGYTKEYGEYSSNKYITVLEDGSAEISFYYDRMICNVTFMPNIDPNDFGVSYKYGTSIDEIETYTPTRQGYTFGGWFTDINLSVEPNDTIKQDMTLYAWWKEETKPCYLIWDYIDDYDSIFNDKNITIKGVVDNFNEIKVKIPTYIGGKYVTNLSKNNTKQSWNGVKELAIPYYIESISQGAFSDCETLETIIINHFTNFVIGIDAFYKCKNLTNVYYDRYQIEDWGLNIKFKNSNSNPMSVAENFYLYESHNSKNYKKITQINWGYQNDIGDFAYYGFNQIEKIFLATPNYVGTGAFMHLNNLKEVWYNGNSIDRWQEINFEDLSANPLHNPSVEKFYIDVGYGTNSTNWQEVENFRQLLRLN